MRTAILLARRAAEALQRELRRDAVASPLGQMFGVLVVAAPAGRVGYLRGFSGMLGGRWQVAGFAPPMFDAGAREAIWPQGQAELRAFAIRHGELCGGERATLERVRAARSRELLVQLWGGYAIANPRGDLRSLRSLFAPASPPGGAGDCAAPKLFGLANALKLRPLALAEFWWGAAGAGGGHQAGNYYPACHRCRRILPHMLDGLGVEPAPPLPADDELRVVFEDDCLVVVEKPCGLRAMPDRNDPLGDSVRVRLRRRDPGGPTLRAASRLSRDASGLLIMTKTPAGHHALQGQFGLRAADQHFVAWLDGAVAGEQGAVELPVGGKRALTEWRVLGRSAEQTRVELVPRTRRREQLDRHTALGLGAPIARGARLMLHASALACSHPLTGRRLELESAPPF